MAYNDVVTTQLLPNSLRTIYSNELEFASRPNMVFNQLVEPKTDFAVNKGQQVVWTIFRNRAPAIGALQETTDVIATGMSNFQTSLTVQEYGDATGTAELLDVLSYQGSIADIAKGLLAESMSLTQEIQARNAFYNTPSDYRYFAGPTGTSARTGLTAGTTYAMTSAMVKYYVYQISINRVPKQGTEYVCVVHPALVYDLRQDAAWVDAQRYEGNTNVFLGEEGMLHGVRFIKSDLARLENGGAITQQTQLINSATIGATNIVVTSTAGFTAGMEVTLHGPVNTTNNAYIRPNSQLGYNVPAAGYSGSPIPNGADPSQESVIIEAVTSSTLLSLRTALQLNHAANDYVTDGVDVYPALFVGAVPACGKGVALPPEIRVALPVDKLHRINYIGWYGIYGHGILRPWSYALVECASSVGSSAPAFPF